MEQDIGPDTRTYLSHAETAARLRLPRVRLYRLAEQDAMLDPSMVIVGGDYRGWDEDRLDQYGRKTKLLTEDGEKRKRRLVWDQETYTRFADVAKDMRRPPKIYLSSYACSKVYDLRKNAVYFIRQRGAFIPADAQVAHRLGWSETRVIEFGEQTGRLDEAGIDHWAVERTRRYGLSPQTLWLQQRLKTRPEGDDLASRIEAAQTAWQQYTPEEREALAQEE